MTIITTLIPASQQTVTQWAGGETRQLAIAPAGATVAARDFHWRFSTATVLQSGPFTTFDGYNRYLAIRSGAGLELAVTAPGAPQQRMQLTSPQHQACFAGAADTAAELLDGPVRDINLMLSAGLQGGLRALQLFAQQPMALTCVTNASWLLYADGLPAGQHIQVQSGAQHWLLVAGDVLILPLANCTLSAAVDCNLVAAWIAPTT
ncbi:HutD family protein [Rheinheimera sp. F8]|uniref:HutD/Ves family protein n=1 Tax=Rheinheimera sp. F8 TaxID=1763998 RepID=UPI000744CA8A|nr:HutD family protein [Rheinheimera sp. F8]ALZ74431.1 hypothetical protein ATY27_00710 [Rheinheimera sp. F8]